MSDPDRGLILTGAAEVYDSLFVPALFGRFAEEVAALVMFYPDPSRGIAEIARVGRGGTVAVWDSIERSDGYTAMQELFRWTRPSRWGRSRPQVAASSA